MYANFSPLQIGVSGLAKLRIQATLLNYNVFVASLSLEGGLNARTAFDIGYGEGNYKTYLELAMAFHLKVIGCVALLGCEDLFDEKVNFQAIYKNGNFSFEAGEGGIADQECPDFTGNREN